MPATERGWVQQAVWKGLEEVDTDVLLEQMAHHVTLRGEWEKGVISPSLVAVECRLQRLKRFLGHNPVPGHMAVRAGRPDGVTNLNFLRGFTMEGVIVAALKHSLGDRVIHHAPLYAPSVEVDGIRYAAHPDVLVEGPSGRPELIQIKAMGVFKLDRMRKYGISDGKTYVPQMKCEMFVVRHSGLPVVRNHLVGAAWENSPRQEHNRVLSWELDWEPGMDREVRALGEEITQDAISAQGRGIWPEALPEHAWDTYPCSYCSFSRLKGDSQAACDDHTAWERPRVVAL